MKKLFTLLLLIPFVASATTLFSWYGGKLPSISERSKEYALYFSDLYKGTKEQNIRFLDAKQGIHGTLAERPRVDVRALAVDPSEYPLLSSTFLGAQNAVGGRVYTLSGSGISASATSLGLTSFKVAGADIKLGMSDFGDLGCGTIEPGNATRQEFVSFTGVTQNADSTATLTGISRGLSPVSPYTASTTQQRSHSGASQFVISNSPPCFYEAYANVKNDTGVTGLYNFSVSPIVGTATSSKQAASREYADSLSITGAPTSTESVMGVSVLSSRDDFVNTSNIASTSNGKPKVLSAGNATSTPKTSAGWTPVTDSTGKIPAHFIATSSPYNFTDTFGIGTSSPSGKFGVQGNAYVSGTTTVGNLTIASSSLQVNGTTIEFPSITNNVKSILSTTTAPNTSVGAAASSTLATITLPGTIFRAGNVIEATLFGRRSGGATNCRWGIDFGSGTATTTGGFVNNASNNSALTTLRATMFISTSTQYSSSIALNNDTTVVGWANSSSLSITSTNNWYIAYIGYAVNANGDCSLAGQEVTVHGN